MNDASLRVCVEAFVAAQVGAAVRVRGLKRFPVGFSWATYAVDLEPEAGVVLPAPTLILRIGPDDALYGPYSSVRQFQLLSALARSPVPTPRVHWHSDDRRILGAPFFFCERVNGRAPLPSVGARDDPVPVHREAMAAQFVGALADLHRFDWRDAPELADWEPGVTVQDSALRQVEVCEQDYARWATRPQPAMLWALHWLRRHAPRAQRLGIVHGDYRIGKTSCSRTGASRRCSTGSRPTSAIRTRTWPGPPCRSSAAAPAWCAGCCPWKTFGALRAPQRPAGRPRRAALLHGHVPAQAGPGVPGRGPHLRARGRQRRAHGRDGDPGRADAAADAEGHRGQPMNNSLPRLYEGMAATLAERILPHLGDDFARGQAYGLIYLLRYLQLRTGWSEAYLAPQWQALQATARRLGPLLHDLRGAPDIDSAAGAGTELPLQARCEALLAALCTAYDWAERHADALPPERWRRSVTPGATSSAPTSGRS